MTTKSSIHFFRDAAETDGQNATPASRLAHYGRQAVASALMLFVVPLSIGDVYAQNPQDAPPPPPDYGQQQGSAYQPLPPEELNRLVAPIALYPDSLVAQVLAASTYPAQVASAEQFVQQEGGAPPEQLGQMANQQPWDPSVKALVAFPQVLDNLNRNMQWTTELGNAYYNQPQDVMGAVQEMRQRAYAAGNLRPNQQLNVEYAPGDIIIQPANPEVVYLPYYDPWVVYGAPIAPWGGYYYHRPSGLAFGIGLAIGFGVGIGIGAFAHFGWGYHNWEPNWRSHTVIYNHNTYISNSYTVRNHGNYGAFDRNPQARAFNHGEAVRFANVNHTTINNVTVNRTNVNNNNFNRGGYNANNNRGGAPNGAAGGGNFNSRSQQNFNQGARPGGQPGQGGQFNGARPGGVQNGQFNSNARPYQGGAQPGQFNGGARTAPGGQFNGGARPNGTPQGQFNGGGRPAQGGQFNGGARPQAAPGQFNGGARPNAAPQNMNRGGGAQPHAAPQQHGAPQRSAPSHESHGEGDHHH